MDVDNSKNSQIMKRLAILGSTGSIGTQVLEVVDANPGLFSVEVLTANNSVELLIQQAIKFKPSVVVVANKAKGQVVKSALEPLGISVYAGEEALLEVVQLECVDMVVS